MSTISATVVGFFPPTSVQMGEFALFFSYAAFLARGQKNVCCVVPEDRILDARFDPTELAKANVFLVARSREVALNTVLAGLQSSHQFVLAFLGKEDHASALDQLALSMGRCLIGVAPTVDDIRHTKQLIARLLALGVLKENIWTIVSHDGIPGGLSQEMMKNHLGPYQIALPFDPALLVACQNEGCFLQARKSKAALTQQLALLAQQTLTWAHSAAGGIVKSTASSVDWQALERHISTRLWRSLRHENGNTALTARELELQIDQELHAVLTNDGMPQLDASHVSRLRQNIIDHVSGLGPLEKFLHDPSINEIMVNKIDRIFLERNGVIEESKESFDSEEQLRTIIGRVVGRMGRRVDLSSPLCDVRLPDGSRVNVVLPPLSLTGPVMTVRRFKPLYRTLGDLLRVGTLNESKAETIKAAVEKRQNVVIAGNSGAGKTTLLNVMAGLIPDGERIITLEDAAELQIDKPHVVRLETRPKNAEGLGEVTMADLVTNALRMRPDRLIIGECRGAEAIPMIQAMNTGHDGSMTTLHANSAEDALKRLESMILLGAPRWPVDVVREQIAAGVDVIVYLKRAGSERKILEIAYV